MDKKVKKNMEYIFNQTQKAIMDEQAPETYNKYLKNISMILDRDNLKNYYIIVSNQVSEISAYLKTYFEYMKPITNLWYIDKIEKEFIKLRELTYFIKEGKFDTLVNKLIPVFKENHKSIDFIQGQVKGMITTFYNTEKLMELSGKELYNIMSILDYGY